MNRVTEPVAVNLMALPIRLMRIWARRSESPIRRFGTSGFDQVLQFQAFLLSALDQDCGDIVEDIIQWNSVCSSNICPASILENRECR